MRTINVTEVGYEAAVCAVDRRLQDIDPATHTVVSEIIQAVRERGDDALLELGRRFDSQALVSVEVDGSEWDAAIDKVDMEVAQSIQLAAGNIRSFHERQRRTDWFCLGEGAVTGQLVRPLERIGVYVPGGRAVYPSSVMMCAIPARVAGVEEIIMCSPCGRDGRLHPVVLYAARTAGVARVFKVGGAQAVAALALGTRTVPRVDKIVGPGNKYVSAAKRLLWGACDMDMVAGPSEVCVVADDTADPAYAAADMLTQAEHDPECSTFFTPSLRVLAGVKTQIERQMEGLPRQDILAGSIGNNTILVLTESIQQALDLANACAPEHLALMVADPLFWVGRVKCAGAVMAGHHTPQSVGDYVAGPSHTLPTSGTARFASPLNVDSFLKKTSYISYSPTALAEVADAVTGLARLEGFEAHARAVEVRLPARGEITR